MSSGEEDPPEAAAAKAKAEKEALKEEAVEEVLQLEKWWRRERQGSGATCLGGVRSPVQRAEVLPLVMAISLGVFLVGWAARPNQPFHGYIV